jgi:hypothetical protein
MCLRKSAVSRRQPSAPAYSSDNSSATSAAEQHCCCSCTPILSPITYLLSIYVLLLAARPASLVASGIWLLAAGCWLLAAGCWLLAARCWLVTRRPSCLASPATAACAPAPVAPLPSALAGPPDTAIAVGARMLAQSGCAQRRWRSTGLRRRHRMQRPPPTADAERQPRHAGGCWAGLLLVLMPMLRANVATLESSTRQVPQRNAGVCCCNSAWLAPDPAATRLKPAAGSWCRSSPCPGRWRRNGNGNGRHT